MIIAFENFIDSLIPNANSKKYLLAVSGGIDSMVMLHLFQQSSFSFAVANINFKLRGEEADNEARFLNNYCLENNIKLFQKEFDTEGYATTNKISIQMAARDLRYQWFGKLAKERNYNYVAIAHHLDDQSETFFINTLRGTGIAGLHGIAKLKDNIIRPLLFSTREEITRYATKNGIPYKDDSSNASDKYQRNYIRHHILPEFYKLRNDFSKSLDITINHINEVEQYANIHIAKELENLIEISKLGVFQININKLLGHNFHNLLLYNALKEYNYHNTHIEDIIKLIRGNVSGKTVNSSTHKITIERELLILHKIQDEKNDNLEIQINSLEDNSWNLSNIKLEFPFSGDFRINNQNLAFLDFEKLEFPLTIRNWKHGDSFSPLGMKGEKKLSDFFIDEKISNLKKRKIKLLCSAKKIIWIIGYRIDNKYKITNNTKRILKLEYYGNN
jgi:tRNA(Ile)-lysidine synthase